MSFIPVKMMEVNLDTFHATRDSRGQEHYAERMASRDFL